MRAWLFDRLTTSAALHAWAGVPDTAAMLDRVTARRGKETINLPKPFLIYGLGNDTNEQLGDPTADDVQAHRQFFQVWLHDSGPSYSLVDDGVKLVKDLLQGASSPTHKIITVNWLETSQEFNNETYNTIFRYVRFQAIIANAQGVLT
jgi:hypothetical protein